MFQETARLHSIDQIAENFWQAFLHSPEIAASARPGQFVNILPSKSWKNAMRRPMSLASQTDGLISIIFKVVGDGTRLMSQWKINEKIDLIGPLGNYWTGYENKIPLLTGGGVGIAPILNLSTHLKIHNIDHYLIFGARNEHEHFIPHEPDKKRFITSDDGSAGIKGNVISGLDQLLPSIKHHENIKVFGCGPPVMNTALKIYCEENKLDCDLALEAIMACGVGICQGCSVEKSAPVSSQHSYRSQYALACVDGPIFNIVDLK